MNRVLLMSVMTLCFLLSTSLRAQTLELRTARHTETLRATTTPEGFGYADPSAQEFLSVGTGSQDYLYGLIEMPEIGNNKITQISFYAVNPTVSEDAHILILAEDFKTTLYSQSVNLVKGWNAVALTTPYATQAGKKYYVGFSLKAAGKGDDNYILPFVAGEIFPEGNWIGIGVSGVPTPNMTNQQLMIQNVAGQKFGTLPVFVKLEKPDLLGHAAYPVSMKANLKGIKTGGTQPVTVELKNFGAQTITSLEFLAKMGTHEAVSVPMTLKTPLAANGKSLITLDLPITIDGEMGTAVISVAKVNDAANVFANVAHRIAYQIGESEAVDRQTVLFERFSTEACPNCPPATPYVNSLIKRFKDDGYRVSYIMHHAGFYTDPFTVSESEELLPYFFAGGQTYAPALSINRVNVVGDDLPGLVFLPNKQKAAIIDAVIQTVKKDKEGARIDRIDQKITGNNIEITIAGQAYRAAFDPTSILLSVVITEDHVKHKNQKGVPVADRATFTHEATPRAFLTPALGQEIKLDEQRRFSVTFTKPLDASWKRGDCKVVAFIHHKLADAALEDRMVYTAETAPLGYGLSNEELLPTEAPRVSVQDGYLSIQGSVQSLEVYDTMGRLVSTDVEQHLEPGYYIVSLLSNLTPYTYKVIVE